MNSKKELLFSISAKDCEFDAFTVGGHGGSGKDTSNTGARCRHKPSGASGEGREHRSWIRNREAAFRKMAESPKFKAWHKIEIARRMGKKPAKSIDEIVDEMMAPANLKIEMLGAKELA